jgi:dienelactone hydrolase
MERTVHMGDSQRWRLALAVSVIAAVVALPVPASAGEPLHLVPPTGRQSVGATELYLKDTSRPDPWVPTQNARELMVTVWYPTNARHGTVRQYLSPAESSLIVTAKHTPVPPEILSTVRTDAFVDAPPAGRPHSLPLIVLSPGYTQPRATLSALAEDLASHGYVVVGIDHTYETYAVTFPDGHIAGCAACQQDDDRTFFGKLYQSRAADVSFVIDRLTGRNSAWRGSVLIDAARIGMSGHSAGGASAIAAMLRDPRIDAGIDMDGTTNTGGDSMIPTTGFSRPFMLLGAPEHQPGGRDTWWDSDWARMTGWRRWLTVAGVDHASFTDLGLFADQLGIDIGATTSGARATEITRAYNLAMFDQHLRHRPQPLLNAPTACYPEVKIEAN